MSAPWKLRAAALALSAATVLWLTREKPDETARDSTPALENANAPRATAAPQSPTDTAPQPTASAPNPSPAPATTPADRPAPTIADTTIAADLERVAFTLRDYRAALRENPVGTNTEITRALLGDNLKQIKLPVPEGSTVNGAGELCDRRGTPYFFHQLSREVMEVRSAGEDRQMRTRDDRIEK